MGRDAAKSRGNVWYEARIRASKYNRAFLSREGAAEYMNLGVDAVQNAELNLDKRIPVDKAILMADAYNAPELLDWYCANECPIGRGATLSGDAIPVSNITLKLVRQARVDALKEIIDRLVDIAEDGEIAEDEIPEVESCVEYLEEISRSTSELRTALERKKNGVRQK